jgi:hypothetical protein
MLFLKNDAALKLGFTLDKDQQICQLLMYIPLLETQLMPEFIMKKIAILRRTNDTISLLRRY